MPQPTKDQDSLGFFQLARGLGIAVILLGHSITPFFPKSPPDTAHQLFSGAGSVLGGGIMAMFFMISGFGFYVRSPKKCFATQAKLLLKPYLLTAAAILVTKLILSLVMGRPFLQHGGELVLTYLLGLNAEGGSTIGPIPIESISILWFILALFGGWLICNSIFRLRSKALRTTLVVGAVLLSNVSTQLHTIWPFCLPMVLLCVGYLAVGYQLRQGAWLDRKLPLWSWILIWTVVAVCAAFGGVNMVACYWRLELLDVVGSFAVGFLLLRLYRRVYNLGHHGKLTRLLETVGFHSLWIVFLHGYEKNIFPWHWLLRLLPGAPGLCVVICFLARTTLMYLLFRLLTAWRTLQRRRRRKKIILEP